MKARDFVIETTLVGVAMNGLSHLGDVRCRAELSCALIRGLGGNLGTESREKLAKEVNFCWVNFRDYLRNVPSPNLTPENYTHYTYIRPSMKKVSPQKSVLTKSAYILPTKISCYIYIYIMLCRVTRVFHNHPILHTIYIYSFCLSLSKNV